MPSYKSSQTIKKNIILKVLIIELVKCLYETDTKTYLTGCDFKI